MKNILILLCLLSCTWAGKTLNVPSYIQEKNQWCWAGCSQMLLDYYEVPVSQGEIAEYALGDSTLNRPNYLWGAGYYNYGGVYLFQRGISGILENWGFAKGMANEWDAGTYTLSEVEWKEEIDNGHPFIINWSWNSGGGHFVVGIGYLDSGMYEIMNPWFGTGYTVATYDFMKDSPSSSGDPNGPDNGYWEYTLTTAKTPPVIVASERFTLKLETQSSDLLKQLGQTLNLTSNSAEQVTVRIFSVNGKMLYEKDLQLSSTQTTLLLPNLGKGVKVLKIEGLSAPFSKKVHF